MTRNRYWDTFFRIVCGIVAVSSIVAIVIKVARPEALADIRYEVLLVALAVSLLLPYISQFEAFGVKMEITKKVDELSANIKALPDYVLGSEYEAEGDHILAEESYRRCLEYCPDFWPALLGLGSIEQDRKDYEQAIRYYQRVLAVDPKNVYALNNLASVYIGAPAPFNNPTRALEMAEKILDTLPSMGSALYYRGEALNQLGRYEEARAIFRGLLHQDLLPEASHWSMYELAAADSKLGKPVSQEELDKMFFLAQENKEGQKFLQVIHERDELARFNPTDQETIRRFLETTSKYIEEDE